ncbi:MAG TPA: prenyltransferase [Thermodesulfobacteriota bacterium]|nr:prenyltransferase [Thermodesulfobacteriota bacterium]
MSAGRLGVWWKAFRFHYTSASFMPGILGGMIAWTTDGKFLPGYFLLVMLGLLLNHMALNMTDDYYDFRHLVDVFATDGKNPYTGGSGLLSSGLIQPQRMRNVFVTFYLIAIAIGVFLGVMRGTFVLVLLAVGFFCAFFYTAPPIRFGYRGLGEIAQLICFGPAIGLGAFYVQAQRVSWEAFWGTLPFGIMLFSMITINEIPDYFEDRKGGKLNLVARFGREAGVWLFILSLLSAYGAILTGVVLGKIPVLGLISLSTFPIAYKTISVLRAHYQVPLKMAPANLGMICTHNFTAILLALVYFIEGFRTDALIASFLPLVVLIILYIPIARLIGRTVLPRKRSGIQGATVQT